ncbi:MFS transporter [Streptomyces clavuligerus]|uniref:Arabinose efflux permease family protein n=1 Tax=Streptomyces clavuligerus TaxID=1901 RepID=D5SLD8_STRCL|nr:MFS transporter [Streptomyces clavuligerus]ANW22597.1 transporter [Streptomyces clavuligerus]AXU16933.1 MFS transporter [Streptomyces clavuligerus]AXU17474.1 MFS transporter [Streptomyces clavuligerus]EFG04731.1 Arabinose efflux permease family protein [Streptomyces clavuligerus]MBY6306823.1 MFS transporter [Streptomyces clavuligerus]
MDARRRALLATVCGVAVAGVYAAQPVLEPMGRDLGVPTGLTGWIVATGQIGYLAGLVLLVPLGDVVDRRRLIAAHLAITAVGLLLTAAAPTAWVAFTGLAVAGVFAVVVQTAVAYTASVSPPAERGRGIGVVTSGVVVGILGARIVTGALAETAGWRGVYLVLAVVSLGLAVLVLVALPPDGRPDRPTGYGRAVVALGGLFGRRVFLTRGLIAFFLFASFGTLWSGMSLPLGGEPWRLSESQIGLFGIAGLAGALGAARAGRWADAGRAAPVTGAALALLVLSWAATGQLMWSLWLLVVGVVLLDYAVQAVHVSNQHLLTAAYPARVSGVIGAYMVFYSLGSALGAAATTAVLTAHGWTGSALLGAGFAVCALAVWAVDRRLPPGPDPLGGTGPCPEVVSPAPPLTAEDRA